MSPAVRNISGIGSRKPIPVHVWIPPKYSPVYKIEIYDGTTATDITSIIIEGDYLDGVTSTIGSFSFKIDNSSQEYTNSFSTYNKIRIYLDYDTTATTQRFEGFIERISKTNNTIVFTGRGLAAKYTSKNVTYAATDTARSTILSEIIAKYFSDLTTTNLSTDSTTKTVNYFDKPFLEVVEEICNEADFDAYINKDNDFNYFAKDSRANSKEAVVHEYNIISTGDFTPDASEIWNKVKVYGRLIDDQPIIATASDSTSQGTYGVKELKINDDSINTIVQAQARADYELANNKNPPIVGQVTSLGLPTILPGEMLRISDPMNGLEPKYYTIEQFRHVFSNDEPFQTILTVKKERSSLHSILKKRIQFENAISSNDNPNEMDYSYVWDFSTDTGTHSSTQITVSSYTGKGQLTVSTGSTGTWISELVSLDSDITSYEVRINGSNVGSVQVFLSTDSGNTFTPLVSGAVVPAGKKIKIKLVLNSSTTIIESVSFLYKL